MYRWVAPEDVEEATTRARKRVGHGGMLRRMKPGLIFTGVIVSVVLLLVCLASAIPAAWPAVAPALSRVLFGSPENIWAYFIEKYNKDYNLATSANFSETLSIPFGPRADLSVLEDWATMRQKDGEIISYTLTLDEVPLQSKEVGSSPEGVAHIWLRSGHERCYRVMFLTTETGYLIQRLAPYPCPEAP